MPGTLFEAAMRSLAADGVEFVANGLVQTIRPGEVIVGTPNCNIQLQAANVIWTAGVRASQLGQQLAEMTACEVDRAVRVVVNNDFSIPGHPEIRIAGDLCS